jgi:hypothetical protein
LSAKVRTTLRAFVDDRGYEAAEVSELDEAGLYEAVSAAEVCISFIDDGSPASRYAMGAAGMGFVPTIPFTGVQPARDRSWIPDEYGPRHVPDLRDGDLLRDRVAEQLDIFEQDFVELEDENAAARYAGFLEQLWGSAGDYGAGTREQAVEVVMGDKYEISGGQTGAVGRGAHAHHIRFEQTWTGIASEVPLNRLRQELEALRSVMRARAATPEEDVAVARVAEAQLAAEEDDGPGALRSLKEAGAWALGVAREIGVSVATAALKAVIGVP